MTTTTACIRRPHSVWTTCKCPDCLVDRRRREKLARHGRLHRVPSDAAWDRLDHLVAMGWSTRAIASATGISRHTLQSAIAMRRRGGRKQRWGAHHAALIVNAGTPAQGSVDATGSRRRIQALSRMGHTLATIAAEAGVSQTGLSYIRSGATTSIRVDTANAIRAAYGRMSMTPGTSDQPRRHAEAMRWPPPLAWDDDTIDDPAARPRGLPGTRQHRVSDEVAIQQAIAGRRVNLTIPERLEVVRRLTEAGVGAERIAELVGTSERNVVRDRARAARLDEQAAS
jgi:lambda repressor-like predicted transcriptional regulator